ncbi:MAG: 4'-phosphopantetheinyl transferase superfamily protein [Ginsengibacter sp.]
MPLFYQHTINDSARLAVWHITENEEFFLEKVRIKNNITHPHKRLQHLAGRFLLQDLHAGFPLHLIEIAESKKPLLSNEQFNFSISHCGDYAAAIVSENKLVGIDVEIINPKIVSLQNKFLSRSEQDILKNRSLPGSYDNVRWLTLFWSAKETIYKWYGRGKIDFKANMILDQLLFENEEGQLDAHFIKDTQATDLKVEFRFLQSLCLAWVLA